jgi:hypothetical protein
MTAPAPAAPRALPQWRDLFLYLLVGGGGFVFASLVAGRFVERGSLTVSILAYALNVFFFAGSVLLIGVARGKLNLRTMGFVPPRIRAGWFIGAILLSLALLPLRGMIGVVAQYLAGGSLAGMQNRLDVIAPESFTWVGFLVTLIGAGVLVPIAEEMYFRGALFTWFRQRYNFPIAMLASSLMFAFGHIDTYGVVAASFVLALVNAWVFEKSKTLWAPILMHITTNSFAVLVIYAALAFAPHLLKTQ